MCVSEMVSAKGLYFNSEKTKELLAFPDNCKCKVVQIFGSSPEIMSKVVEDFGEKFDIIDINMGCPAPKIFKNGEGSALMGNLELARQIISSCVKVAKVPITVKFRSGIDENSINAVEFAKMCEEAGASAITIHPRTREQFYSGNADWKLIKDIVNAVKIPVIGNGDVVDKQSYEKMKQETGCAGVMIGRGALGNPQIFSEILNKEAPYSPKQAILNHVNELSKYFDETFIGKHMRKHLIWYLHGMYNAKVLKEKAIKVTNIKDIKNLIDEIFK